jgi:hypothetical protein
VGLDWKDDTIKEMRIEAPGTQNIQAACGVMHWRLKQADEVNNEFGSATL